MINVDGLYLACTIFAIVALVVAVFVVWVETAEADKLELEIEKKTHYRGAFIIFMALVIMIMFTTIAAFRSGQLYHPCTTTSWNPIKTECK